MTLEKLIRLLSNVFVATFREHLTMACICLHHLSHHLLLIQMKIELVVPILVVPRLNFVFSWVTIFYLGLQRDKILCLVPVQKQSIVVSPISFLILVGFEISFLSYIVLFLRLLWCTMTISMQYISQVIQFNINGRSI